MGGQAQKRKVYICVALYLVQNWLTVIMASLGIKTGSHLVALGLVVAAHSTACHAARVAACMVPEKKGH